MDSLANSPLKPRKSPVQARSAATLEAIFEATIQVLLTTGHEKMTTTRVAERAGVSVGSLYQYYPNKHALLAATIERHLITIVEAVEAACKQAHGHCMDEAGRLVCDAFLDAKMKRVDVSRALYGPANELDAGTMVRTLMTRALVSFVALMESVPDLRLENPPMTALFLLSAMVGPVQAVIEAGAPPFMVEALREHLRIMALGYLRGLNRPVS